MLQNLGKPSSNVTYFLQTHLVGHGIFVPVHAVSGLDQIIVPTAAEFA